jgi:MFS family permease
MTHKSLDDAFSYVLSSSPDSSSRFQRLLFFAAGLAFASDAVEVTLLSFLSYILMDDDIMGLSSMQSAALTSSVFAGMILGSLFFGVFADIYGRRLSFLYSSTVVASAGVLSSLAPSYRVLVFLRCLVGIGIGGFNVPFDLVAEFSPKEGRGRRLMSLDLWWSAGSITVPIVAIFTIGSKETHWRLFLLLCSAPTLLALPIAYHFVPESPRFLVETGQVAAAEMVLKQAATMNGLDSGAINLVQIDDSPSVEMTVRSKIDRLLSPKTRTTTIIQWAIWLCFGFSYYGLILLISRIFRVDGAEDFASILISCTAEGVATIAAMMIVDTVGRVALQKYAYLSAGLCIFLFAVTGNAALAFLARGLVTMAHITTWVHAPELHETATRTTGHAICNSFARIGAFMSPYVVFAEETFSVTAAGAIICVASVIAGVCSAHLPETNGVDLSRRSAPAPAKQPASETKQKSFVGAMVDAYNLME